MEGGGVGRERGAEKQRSKVHVGGWCCWVLLGGGWYERIAVAARLRRPCQYMQDADTPVHPLTYSAEAEIVLASLTHDII